MHRVRELLVLTKSGRRTPKITRLLATITPRKFCAKILDPENHRCTMRRIKA